MKKDVLKVGTLINDNGKIGIISNVIEMGELDPKIPIISWRANYEITYTDGTKLVLSCYALEQMLTNKKIIVYDTTTPLPHFSSTPDVEEAPTEEELSSAEKETCQKNKQFSIIFLLMTNCFVLGGTILNIGMTINTPQTTCTMILFL
jgi:hypothetical protein